MKKSEEIKYRMKVSQHDPPRRLVVGLYVFSESELQEYASEIAREQWSLDIRKARKFGGLKELEKIELVTDKP